MSTVDSADAGKARVSSDSGVNTQCPDASSERWFGSLNNALSRMLPNWSQGKTQRDLCRCGYSSPVAHENLLALRNVLLCGCILVLLTWSVVLEDEPDALSRLFILGMATTLILVTAPRVVISFWGEARVKRITSAMPDALDLIAMAMSGGASFQQALASTAEQLKMTHSDLAFEMALICDQSQTASVTYALSRFQQRMEWPQLDVIVDNLAHSVAAGTSLRTTLENLSDRVRGDRLRQAADRANRNVVVMLLPIVLCLAPAALIMVFTPPLIKLKEFRDQAKGQGGVLSRDVLMQPLSTASGPTQQR